MANRMMRRVVVNFSVFEKNPELVGEVFAVVLVLGLVLGLLVFLLVDVLVVDLGVAWVFALDWVVDLVFWLLVRNGGFMLISLEFVRGGVYVS